MCSSIKYDGCFAIIGRLDEIIMFLSCQKELVVVFWILVSCALILYTRAFVLNSVFGVEKAVCCGCLHMLRASHCKCDFSKDYEILFVLKQICSLFDQK